MLISALSKYLEKLEKTASRNEMTEILAEVLKAADREEIKKICYLLLGELLPAYRGVEFNLAEKMMVRVLAEAYGSKSEEVLRKYRSLGDLGDVAAYLAVNSKLQTPTSKLSVVEVYGWMLNIAEDSGEGSQERKINKMAELLVALDPLSAKYVARIPVGKLRLGFSDATLLDALSVMEKGDKSARKEIERAYNVTADIGLIAERVKKGGLKALKNLEAEPGIPIRPALAERLQKIEELFEKAGSPVGVEQKLDGFRTQVHILGGRGARNTPAARVSLFSRNLENTTRMFPEIAHSALKLPVKSAILDGETIGFDPRTGKFAPFQETVQRKRKHDVAEFVKKIPLVIFVFDILYKDGKSYLSLSFRERRRELEELFGGKKAIGAIHLAKQKETESPEEIQAMLEESLKQGLEGLVIKNLSLPYEAGSRGFHWIKLKETSGSLEKLRLGKGRGKILDTIDCVVMGAYRGRGKRAKFGLGGFLLGVKGQDDRYYTISRLGTGLSDEQFMEVKKRIGALRVSDKPKDYVVDKEIEPAFWLRPSLVAEILADEITLSPRHTAGRLKEGGRGYSLRFPRLVRFRDDKNPEDATTVKEIEKMYKQQKVK